MIKLDTTPWSVKDISEAHDLLLMSSLLCFAFKWALPGYLPVNRSSAKQHLKYYNRSLYCHPERFYPGGLAVRLEAFSGFLDSKHFLLHNSKPHCWPCSYLVTLQFYGHNFVMIQHQHNRVVNSDIRPLQNHSFNLTNGLAVTLTDGWLIVLSLNFNSSLHLIFAV